MSLQVRIFQSENRNLTLLEHNVNAWLNQISEESVLDVRTSATSYGYGESCPTTWQDLFVTILYRSAPETIPL